MIRYLSLREVLVLHERIAAQSGGGLGVRDLGLLESAIALPRQAFGDQDLYPTVADKAAALGFSIVSNHPFVDGNKRVGHAAMEIFLVLNGYELVAKVAEQEAVILRLAAGELERAGFTEWVGSHAQHVSE